MNTPINLKIDKLLIKKDIDMPVKTTIADVVMWLYEKYGIWIACNISPDFETFSCYVVNKKIGYDTEEFNSPTEAYEAAILYVLENLI